MHVKEWVLKVTGVVVKASGFIGRHKKASIAVSVALLLVVPLLLTGDREVFVVNAVGLGFGALVLRRFIAWGSARRLRRR